MTAVTTQESLAERFREIDVERHPLYLVKGNAPARVARAEAPREPSLVAHEPTGPVMEPAGSVPAPLAKKTRFATMKRLMLKSLTPFAVAFSLLVAAPVQALQQVDVQTQDRPVIRRRAPAAARRQALAFVRTELFFGAAKPEGVVTEEEFRLFVDDEVTPLFPDGLTVMKADGQFRGADGVTIKEDSFVLILLYPLDSQKASSRNIDIIRERYLKKHQQESVLRVDDPFLVWVSF